MDVEWRARMQTKPTGPGCSSQPIFIIFDGGLVGLNVFYISGVCGRFVQTCAKTWASTLSAATFLFFCPRPVERDEKSGLIRQQALWAGGSHLLLISSSSSSLYILKSVSAAVFLITITGALAIRVKS